LAGGGRLQGLMKSLRGAWLAAAKIARLSAFSTPSQLAM
jgi:hypothetical protein